ncbi:hypothetical protein ANN_05078 [Periplaneta americana]|uniref:Uncharacterized protein n=1 Tax=Periplaneta americana TaxID=6978 RepID=A0ABQ8TA53_PERAM|nr:hypothetical protein ANN_05078 [Periplaneta americana]
MASLCDGGNEPACSLKAICKLLPFFRVHGWRLKEFLVHVCCFFFSVPNVGLIYEGGESRPPGQVAPSTGHSLETTTGAGRLWTSSGQRDNYDSASGGNESRKNQSRKTFSDKLADSDGDQQSGIGNQRQDTPSGRTDIQASGGPPSRAGNDIEEIITRKKNTNLL